MTDKELIGLALNARRRAYAPYSGFYVGAALLCRSGKVYLGCNIENAAYSPTNCAERTAFFKAVSEGDTEFDAIAVVGGPKDAGAPLPPTAPCGVCRQVMAEFCGRHDFRIILARDENDYRVYDLDQLLPAGFTAENLADSGK